MLNSVMPPVRFLKLSLTLETFSDERGVFVL